MKRMKTSKGFVLPATIMLGLAISIMAATFTQYIVSSSQLLNGQSYRAIAQEAAYSGLTYAISCIGSASTGWPSLTPNTTCSGVPEGSIANTLVRSPTGEWRTTFTVDQYDVAADSVVSATGTVTLSSGIKISETRNVTISTALAHVPAPSGSDKFITDLSTDSHSCAIANGQLYCWGPNSVGQLGDGTTTTRNTPTQVPAFIGKMVTQVVVGTGNSCAVADGQLYCWGDNSYGQLGIGVAGGSPSYRSTPQAVLNPDGMSDFKVTNIGLTQSADPYKSACAIANGIVFCWGANNTSQLGQTRLFNVDRTARYKPTPILGYRSGDSSSTELYGKKSTSVGVGTSKGCTASQGDMYCWGSWINSPVTSFATTGDYGLTMPPILPWSIKVVDEGFCSINRYLVCHGTGIFDDSILFASHVTKGSPDEINTFIFNDITDYDSDEYTSKSDGVMCVVSAGFPVCRGAASYTGTSLGNWRVPISPTNIYLTTVTKVGIGEKYGCILPNGALACWGDASQGQLADGSNTSSASTPKFTGYPTIGVNQSAAGSYFAFGAPGPISAGRSHRCTAANAVLFCWGANNQGQLGTGDNVEQGQPTMTDASNLPHWTLDSIVAPFTPPEKISSAGDHSCMITLANLFCWGANTYGQLGIGNTTAKNIPTGVPYFNNLFSTARVTDVSVGAKNACAVAEAKLYCWGDRSNGIIGGSLSGIDDTPTLVSAFSSRSMNVTSVSVGTDHACAVVNGDGYCWGKNTTCQTGRSPCSNTIISPSSGKITSGTAATSFGNLTTGAFTQISAGNGYSCATINGAVSCWGKNDKGQTGTNGPATVTSPTQLSNGGAGVLNLQADALSTGDTHACAVLQGRIYCWGDNTNGKLGDGTEVQRSVPVLINGGAMGDRVTVNIAAGDDGTCSVSNGSVLCWGAGLTGQVGDNGWINRSLPTLTSGYRMTGSCSDFNCKGPLY